MSVFISGASGFIAQHIIKQLLSKGYQVVGTVRSAAKGQRLQENFGPSFQYEIVPDITATGAFDEALKKHLDSVKYVLHTASPFFYNTTQPERDLIIPAIQGTKNILGSITQYAPKVSKVVITSSDAAIYSAEDEQNSALSFDETSWNNISYADACKDPIYAYYGAKSFAEKLAWEFLKVEVPDFDLVAINPVYVFGPQAFDSEVKKELNTSNEYIYSLIKNGPHASFDNAKGSYVDVRDVARAHVAALDDEKLVGKRLFLTNGQFSIQMILDTLREKFPQLASQLPEGTPGSGPEDIKSLAKSSNEATRKLLGFEFRNLDTIVEDTIEQILRVNPQ
ncbi:NAD(P)-binding protein [Suhomyces tanzawaensis NRRL Y-17324]|uniref:NAD(P)-binding protein n=1 Tax=Suhomyces tanzawaensis NRRL Y-17324 TaxID=984487 RepID=A0A1E4SDG5_9ASCO|nr:NAD(P)-binding protein [Suhomyces tanzawaensis NRRL Y-17324]ODV77561.1 NAD(P)-binding protein [Suhomyces tanzawaensis NRRL Y-17324]